MSDDQFFQNVPNEEVREIIRILENVQYLMVMKTGKTSTTWKTVSGYLANCLADIHRRRPRMRPEIEQMVGVFTDEDVKNIH